MRFTAARARLAGSLVAGGVLVGGAIGAAPASAFSINCAESTICTEVANYSEVFGANYYVGHDEPSTLFYSKTPGSGNRMRYTLTLPSDPSPSNPTIKSYNFQLHGAFWFGLAMCDTQSYPEQVKTCPADSDKNILDPSKSPKHSGSAFTELQFYPPGWVKWPTWAVAVGSSACDPHYWCAALNIDSLSQNPVAQTQQNPTCAAKVGLEYVNFAFVTRDGKSQAPANPLQATIKGTYTPDPGRALFMKPGDKIAVTMHDSASGLVVVLQDLTTGKTGSMTASPANGFAQMKFAPTGTSCTAIPYAFHPMYSTSSPKTRVIWAAHTYNVSFADEIGHWQKCNGKAVPATPFGVNSMGVPISCPGANKEDDKEAADADDNYCFPASEASLVRVQGCTDTNTGFDGVAYHPAWPDGNTTLHPTPIRFTSPLTGSAYTLHYAQAGLEADLPRVEFTTCDRTTGAGCTLIPTTDDGTSAAFYPYFSIAGKKAACYWQLGDTIPGTTSNFGKNAGYGTLLKSDYIKPGGGVETLINNFRHVFTTNPCL